MGKNGSRLVALAVLALLAACQKPQGQGWVNSTATQETWSSDVQACREAAANKTRLEERQANSYGGDSVFPSDTFQAQTGQVQQVRRQRDLFESCLDAQGYRRADPQTGP
jgi:hypothetical protein